MNHHTHPAVATEIAAIDWILRRLARLLAAYPKRATDLSWRIDAALDERLRLMRVRDLHQRNHIRIPAHCRDPFPQAKPQNS
jgi:hypothetical protein